MTLPVADYRLDIFNPSNVLQAQLTDFNWLYASKMVNRPGTLRAMLRGDHPAIASLSHRSRVKLYRRDPTNSLAFYLWFDGLFLKQKYTQPEASTFALTAVDLKWLLSTRVVAWHAGTANRSEFISTKAETIAKTLVDYNAGAGATTGNGRLRLGTITNLTIQTDAAGGNTVDWFCFGKNLLETLRELMDVGGGDFDLVPSGNNYDFRFYAGQLGTDRTASVTFALERGNMAKPEFDNDRIDEKTVAIVGGQDIGINRTFVVRTGPDYASGSNDVELFTNQSGIDTTAGLNAAGDQILEGTKQKSDFTFDVIQTESTKFDVHYFLGDLVKAVNPFTGATSNRKVDLVSITASADGSEKIDIGLVIP